MQLYIPPLGSQLILSADWTFLLSPEERNKTLFEYMGKYQDQPMYRGSRPVSKVVPATKDSRAHIRALTLEEEKLWAPKEITLPAGTLLQVDRIYIRKGQDDFDSITFTLPGKQVRVDGITVRRTVRFWTTLEDANRIQFNHP